MRQPLVAGNWKMNGSRASIRELLDGVKAGMGEVKTAEVAVCSPHIFLCDVQQQLDGSAVAWGGQDISVHESGAYTGETAGSMLAEFGCKYVIIGHSERRTYHGETDQVVAEKFVAARKAGLVPILCIGETLEERESGITEEVVGRQIDAVIAHCGVEMLGEGVIAYEPVWAIGTGKTASPEQAQEVHAFIRGRIAAASATVAEGLRILYGGSMNPGNAAQLLAQSDIDGGLIGGASLKAADFLAIATAANA
ncbi:triose-phosphate isomerase [endosymbiont of unidentified scaly snail isolate Monju]|uniref:triose-phosphate isomerase n=1 Tax=endosymbiont of unidentified scaly snail isolate Monju TaxID=1248727 RepID=UPI0005BAF07C|nr:triose-phosphate isomerase [endosymbiont of unidentified scaly snail isolate Monju]